MSRIHRLRSSPSATFGDVVYEPGSTLGPRTQADYQAVIVLRGSARIQSGPDLIGVPAQHCALLRPGRLEYFEFDGAVATHHTWCAVAPELVSAHLAGQLPKAGVLPLSARVNAVMEAGLALPSGPAQAAQEVFQHLGQALLWALVLDAELTERSAALPPALTLAKDLIDRGAPESADVKTLARFVGVSPSYLVKLFRHHTGQTPARYLWQSRMRRGVDLLGQTGLSIGEIATRAGFQTPFHFSHMIKKNYGLTPSQIRANAWGGERRPRWPRTGPDAASTLER